MTDRRLLPDMVGKPFDQSYWVIAGKLCAGHYPGSKYDWDRDAKLRGLLNCGIRLVINLMENNEIDKGGEPFKPYEPRLQELAAERGVSVDCVRMGIPDAGVPEPERMQAILDAIHESVAGGIPTYVHCWGGHGRTSTVVACYLIQHGKSPEQALDQVLDWRRGLPKHHYPFEDGQVGLIKSWPGPRGSS